MKTLGIIETPYDKWIHSLSTEEYLDIMIKYDFNEKEIEEFFNVNVKWKN